MDFTPWTADCLPVFAPLTATQIDQTLVADMPTPITHPLSVIDENSRNLVEYDFDTILNHPQVMIRDRDAVEKKLRLMVDGGKEKLLVISDFDYTLSRFEDSQGRRCWTTHGVFDNCTKQFDPELAQKFQRLKDKYFPIVQNRQVFSYRFLFIRSINSHH
ncbi:hypothetical protein Q1695_010124 [Nippostrongylus brasiliensis]|nr:hypothetical protein Q1695_010124 [Nippostrongylus brasiliensis]